MPSTMIQSRTGQATSRPSPLACSECRYRHLKCNGGQPSCSRCLANGLSCFYTPSRRGRAPRNKRDSGIGSMMSCASSQSSLINDPQFQAVHNVGTLQANPLEYSDFQSIYSSRSATPAHSNTTCENVQSYNTVPANSPENWLSSDEIDDCEGYIQLFYTIFHRNHPLMVPQPYFSAQKYPRYLKLVIQFIGSHYSTAPRHGLREDAISAVLADDSKSVHKVQALILLAIVLHARYEPIIAQGYAMKAVDVALEIGLNTPDTAMLHGRLDPVVEESLRRTWWEVFVVDGYIAALHQQPSFRANEVRTHAFLPCEELDYERGTCGASPPRSLDAFENRFFGLDDFQYSSYCYRIEAIRILGRVLALDPTRPDPSQLQAIDNALIGWRYHIPESKAGTTGTCSRLDPMIFQGTIFIHCASIILHFPRSRLPIGLPPASTVECARYAANVSHLSAEHAAKAVVASEQLNTLATVPAAGLVEHSSPFFVCGLVLGCVVQLSAFSGHSCDNVSTCHQLHKDQVSLTIGALTALSRHWAVAAHVLHQLKVISGTLFNPHLRTMLATPNPVGSDNYGGDQSWLDIFYNDTMQYQPLASDIGHS